MSAPEMFTQFPALETPRLSLRQIVPGDAEALFATFSDPTVMEFYGDPPHRLIEDSRDLIRRQEHWYAQREGIRWGITLTGASDTVIGSCGFFLFDEEFRRAEMGYELAQAYWRQGIMREALGAIISYAFAITDLHRIEAVVNGANEPSKTLLRVLGFMLEGTLRQRFYFASRYWETCTSVC
ncbi:MAG TPA: GNAT family protein [Ktedonobacterales bacterium]|jgi:ribosomal-protein-alanine N-acetyltransferase